MIFSLVQIMIVAVVATYWIVIMFPLMFLISYFVV